MSDRGNIIYHPNRETYLPSPIKYIGDTLGPKPHIQPAYGTISGAVVYSTTPVAYSPVVLIYEPTNKIVSTALTDASGLFSFPNILLGGSTYTYRVVAYRDTQNARVYSGVQSINPY